MSCYANAEATTTAAKREPRRGASRGAKMSHSQPRQGLCPVPALLPRQGQGLWAKGKHGQARPHAGAATSPHVTAICASLARPPLRGHRLELCLNNNSAQPRRELQSTRRANFFFFSFFHAPSQCNICSGALSKEKARC